MEDFDSLYREYAVRVYKYIFSCCHSYDISEEITQETFYRAIKSIKNYNGSCKVDVWLCQIAKHIWYQILEKQHKKQTVELTEANSIATSSLEEDFIFAQEKMELFKQLQLLDANTREVIYLRLTGEFSFREIGEILGKEEIWARVTFYRGKQKIMKGRKL